MLPDLLEPAQAGALKETPLVEIDGIWAKLECTNASGSIKDRIAFYILGESRRRGLLAPGARIVEATSGNTGIAIAHFGKQFGHPVTIVMPSNMTEERKAVIRALGAELILCSEGGFAEAAAIRDRIVAERGAFNPDQFSNPLNPECHRRTTGPEILRQLAERGAPRPDAFVAGVGTGGTLIGVAEALRADGDKVRIVAVEPEESAVMNGGEPGLHGIYGIGDGFIPPIASDGKGGLHPAIDEVAMVSTADAIEAAKQISEKYGHCVGISSGANFVAARRLASRFSTVVTVFPDGYTKYTSEGLQHCEPGGCKWEHISILDQTLHPERGRQGGPTTS